MLDYLYNNVYENLSGEEDKTPIFSLDIFKRMIKRLSRNKKIDKKLLTSKEVVDAIGETSRILAEPIKLVADKMPEKMKQKLNEDVFVFSGCKTYQQLKEMRDMLKDEKGNILPYHKFEAKALEVHEKYNRNYLKAEYLFSTQSSRMAAQWAEVANDDDYYLQYRTAADDKVRQSHAPLHDITLPASDPFWKEFYPPNGWRCRCTVKQVRKEKYDKSDSSNAYEAGKRATTDTNAAGVNKAEMFRFNPGIDNIVFPPQHPYYKVQNGVKKTIKSLYDEDKANS